MNEILPAVEVAPAAAPAFSAGCMYFAAHGDDDDVVPKRRGRGFPDRLFRAAS